MWVDAGYVGGTLHAMIIDAYPGVILPVCQKGAGHPLTEEQKKQNTIKSRVRVRVEHTFGHMTTVMGGITVTQIGLARATVRCSLRDFASTMWRSTIIAQGMRIGAVA